MVNFYKNNRNIINQKLEELVPSDEKIIWNSKPHYDSYAINQIFSSLWIFIIGWAMINAHFIAEIDENIYYMNMYVPDPIRFIYVSGCIIRLFPIWLSIIYIFTYGIRWKKEEYLCTDERIYKMSGLFIPKIRIVELNKIKKVKEGFMKTHNIFGTSHLEIVFDEEQSFIFYDIKADSIKVYLEEQILKNSEEYKKNMEK